MEDDVEIDVLLFEREFYKQVKDLFNKEIID